MLSTISNFDLEFGAVWTYFVISLLLSYVASDERACCFVVYSMV